MVTSQWEADGVAQNEQRPPRRYYELTADGRKALADNRRSIPGASASPRTPRLRPARHSRG